MREPLGLRPRMHRSGTHTDVSWVEAQSVTRKQRPAAVNSRSVPSGSRSVGTTTRVADVKKTVAPAKSSLQKLTNPLRPKQQVEPVHES